MTLKTAKDDRSSKARRARSRAADAAVTVVRPAAAATGRWWEWLILAGLVVVLLAQLGASVRPLSATWDEPDHLHAGYRYLKCGDFGWNPEHPPLAKMVDALPLLFQLIQDPVVGACGYQNNRNLDFRVGHEFLFANPESVLLSARMMASLFTVGLLCVVWIATRNMFGLAPACIAGALLVFDPNVLAHGALVTTDVPAAFGTCAAVLALYAYFAKRTRVRWLLAGVATGLAFSLKHSTVLLVPILLAVAVADPLLRCKAAPGRRMARNLLAVGVMLMMAVLVLWTVYGWRYAGRPDHAETWTTPRLQEASGTMATKVIPQLEAGHLLPEAYLKGLQDVLVTSEVGRPSYILGRLYRSGRWFYFPLAIVIKFPLAVLLLAVAGCGAVRFWRERRRELLFVALPPLIYLASGMTSGLNMGVRHLLPALPFLIMFASAGAWALLGQSRKLQAAMALVLVFQAASSLRAFPNYISYSNELWGGPANTYKYLAVSDADWGQALKQAKAYVERTRPKSCWVIRSYYASNTDYGIPCGESSELVHQIPPVRFSGTLIVSSSAVNGIDTGLGGTRLAAIFHGREPKAKLGGSALLVYEGDFDLSALAAYQHLSLAKQQLGRNLPGAMVEAEAAVALGPESPGAHMLICSLARAQGDLGRAERECNRALSLFRNDPNATALDSAYLEKFMRLNGINLHVPERR